MMRDDMRRDEMRRDEMTREYVEDSVLDCIYVNVGVSCQYGIISQLTRRKHMTLYD